MTESLSEHPVSAPLPAACFCRRCSRRIRHSETGPRRCANCLLRYDPNDPGSYLRRRRIPHWTLWAPGLCWALLLGLGSYALIHEQGVLGAGAFLALPAAVGGVVGYCTGLGLRLAVGLSILTAVLIVVMLVAFGVSGLACGMWLIPLFLVPTAMGAALGAIVQRFVLLYMPEPPRVVVALIAAFPWLVAGAEFAWSPPPPTRVVRTTAVFDASAGRAFDAIAFYEEEP